MAVSINKLTTGDIEFVYGSSSFFISNPVNIRTEKGSISLEGVNVDTIVIKANNHLVTTILFSELKNINEEPAPEDIKEAMALLSSTVFSKGGGSGEGEQLPEGTSRQVGIFDTLTNVAGKLIAGLFRPRHWSQVLRGEPTESGTYLAAFTNNPVDPDEDMFFIKTVLTPEFGTIPIYDVGGELFTSVPTDANHATNKTYVDDQITLLTNRIVALETVE